MRTSIRSLSIASASALCMLTASGAQAQETVNPTPKGIVGGALLGAEVGTIVESIAGVKSPWVYVITDVVLGAGGAVGGWEVEQHSTDGRAPVFLLAGGLGLVIPAIVLTLNATRYRPTENASEDHAPTNGPPANPATPGGGSLVAPPPSSPPPPPPAHTSEAQPPSSAVHLSLLDVSGGGMHLGLPVPEIRPVFSASELRQYGFAQQTEVRMPLVKIAF
jgi:hypothetical protein